MPLLADPALPALPKRGAYAYAQYPRKTTQCSPPALDCGYPHAMGYTVRTPEWRYTEWVAYDNVTYTPNFDVPFTEGGTIWRELYDHRGDVGANWEQFERVNVAAVPANAATVAQLSAALRSGPNLLHPAA